MTLLATVALIALHAIALYGWGRAFARVCRLPNLPPALLCALGLAVVVGLGGVLNLAGWVSRPVLSAVVGTGIAAALVRRRVTTPTAAVLVPKATVATLATALIAVAVLLIVAAAVVPALAFNFKDDFQKYFAHPARMLQTGRVSGSVLSAIGFETLGGQAFLHAFVLNVAGFDALNAVDLGLALPLCLLIVGLGPAESLAARGARLVAVLAVLVINPQVVNVSSAFTASALTLAALLLSDCAAIDRTAPPDGRHAWAAGCLFAGLCALKTSFVLLVAALIASYGVALLMRTRSPRLTLRWTLLALASSALWLAPWLAVHASNFAAAFEVGPALPPPTPFEPYSVDVFSNELRDDSGYGDGFLPYTCAVLATLGIGAFGVWAAPRGADRPWCAYLACAVAVALAGVYAVMLYVVGPLGPGSITSLRLFVPMLIGVLPAVLVFASRAARPRRALWGVAPLVLAAAVLVPFVLGAPGRIGQAFAQGHVLGFSALAQEPWYVRYNHYTLHGPMREQVAAAQAAVPEGARVIAWINAPFWLDFKRNRVHDLDLAGLETPWSRVPDAAYVIWEHNGVATPAIRGYEIASHQPGALQARIGAAGLRMTYAMIDLARQSRIVYNDKQIMVLQLEQPALLWQRYGGR